ncbi:MOSC domain-containing protein [Phenylobacterium sp.]|jgi:MOSC domain-containing protein YiiM|uniref:MOSC domain-containing protein n=1 Tax=Phenylobacterium sp. TaxID=1871053 RepID=UPI002F931967
MLSPTSPLGRLLAGPLRTGEVVWIGARPGRRAPMTPLARAVLEPGNGLAGDRYHSRTTGTRAVTLIAAEDLAAIAGFLGLDAVAPERLRRNIVTRGVNLLALKDRRFRVGGVVLQWTGECHPCSRMEEELGPGGYNAVRGHGGITAAVLEAGEAAMGDAVARLEA